LAAEKIIVESRWDTIQKRGKGHYDVVLHRVSEFHQRHESTPGGIESPLTEPLRMIGLDDAGIGRVLKQYHPAKVREWADITLAAKERFGLRFFKRSPVAYLLDNLKKSMTDGRTPPDWWHGIRMAEETKQATIHRNKRSLKHPDDSRNHASREAFDKVRRELFLEFRSAGLDEDVANREASRRATSRTATAAGDKKADLASVKEILAHVPIKLA